jgi:DNA-binding protein Fis
MQSQTTDLYETAVRLLEGSLIPAVMRQTGHNRTAAARVLGMDRATLRTRLKDLDPIEDTTG